MWFLPGLPGNRVALFIRLHHVMSDGMAGVADLAAFLDDSPVAEAAPPPPWDPAPPPSAWDLLADNAGRRAARVARMLSAAAAPGDLIRRIQSAWPSLREVMVQAPGPLTSLNRLVGPDRVFGLVRSELEAVKRVARSHGATVNDVLLDVTAAGLRGLLSSRGEATENLSLPVYVPVSLRPLGVRGEGGNLISQMVVRLPVGSRDPGVRLRQIAAETARRKMLARPSLGTTFRSRLVSAVLLRRIARQRVNAETADLPGPQDTLYFAGAELLEIFPLLNLIGNVSLGVGAISYAGQFNAMAIADGGAYPDLDEFTKAAQTELRALTETAVGSHS
jgi:WS/DGAT/MGAT family acyltransferase